MRNAIVTTIAFLIAAAASGQLVATRSSSQQFLIPAAGAQQGNGGTFFRSDITIINYRGADQRIRLQWLPQDVSAGSGAPIETTIAASSGIASEDFVTTVMQRSGLGAILVTAIDATGAFDSRAQLVATSRIWTPQPGSGGTTSQSLPAIATSDINSSALAILGARRDARYRTNVGIVNVSSEVQSFQVVVFGSFGTEVRQIDVQPLAMVLFAVTGPASTTPLQIQVQNVTTVSRSSSFVAYASSVDNVTGDAWTTLGSNVPVPFP
ncbi:MAG TPA: hypothetical protein VGQ46_10050 [Thermoanaerobaculia bacterium]|jgi:hypothetical protein|nr:hypothetical protein [Thermoanaerobaculia bacterium]